MSVLPAFRCPLPMQMDRGQTFRHPRESGDPRNSPLQSFRHILDSVSHLLPHLHTKPEQPLSPFSFLFLSFPSFLHVPAAYGIIT